MKIRIDYDYEGPTRIHQVDAISSDGGTIVTVADEIGRSWLAAQDEWDRVEQQIDRAVRIQTHGSWRWL